jgi:hypothetical protein
LEVAQTTWQSLLLEWGDGGRSYLLEITLQTAVWYHAGSPPVPIRWVLPQGKLELQAFLSTNLEATPEQILLWFRQRWHVEVPFEEVRAHLGVETQRQWSDLTVCNHRYGKNTKSFTGLLVQPVVLYRLRGLP